MPQVAFLQTGLVPGAQRPGSDDEARDHHGQHTRGVDVFGADERRERDDEALHRLQGRVVQVPPDPQRGEPDDEADERPDDGVVAEQSERILDEGVWVLAIWRGWRSRTVTVLRRR